MLIPKPLMYQNGGGGVRIFNGMSQGGGRKGYMVYVRRGSPDFRSPEVSISVFYHYSNAVPQYNTQGLEDLKSANHSP